MIHDDCTLPGGTNVHRIHLSKLLELAGHEVYLFTYNATDEKHRRCCSYKIKRDVKYVRHIERRYFNPGLFFALRRWIRETRPDAIHIHHNNIFTNTVLLACGGKVPAVQTVHDWRIVCFTGTGLTARGDLCPKGWSFACQRDGCIPLREYLLSLVPRRITRYLLRRNLRALIVPSRALQAMITKCFGSESVYIPNYVDCSLYPIVSVVGQKPVNILYVGILESWKGVDVVLQALALVKNCVPEITLTIVGEGAERNQLVALAEMLRLGGAVNFQGEVPQEQLPQYYSKAHIVVVSSVITENCPLTVLEAMAAGKPVIGSRIGGIPELVVEGETGLLFTPGDANELHYKLRELLLHPDKAQSLGTAGRRRVEAEFSPVGYLDAIMRLYKT